jgi:serine phosphatase RsbU (regulator of sigma subunit)
MASPEQRPIPPQDLTTLSPSPIPFEKEAVDWLSLVDHQSQVPADESLEQVQHRFQQTEGLRYLAVVEDGRAIGLCAARQLGLRLSSQYGFALFARQPIRNFLVPHPLVIHIGQPWAAVLERVFSRTEDDFTEDALLLDEDDRFCGLIAVQTLVRLQTRLLAQSIVRLEEQQTEISRRNRQMTEDLLMAREMQLAMLPRGLPEASSGVVAGSGAVEVSSHYAPLAVVSGDFFEMLALSETTVGVLIADVMGHGVQAALITAMMRALIQDHEHLAVDPGHFLGVLNNGLTVILESCQIPTFVSAFALVMDVAAGTLGFSNAGHPGPFLLRDGSSEAVPIDCEQQCNGGLLGIGRDTVFPSGRMPVQAGDRVLLFTDGLFEIRGADGDLLGPEGLRPLVARLMAKRGEDLVHGLVEAVRAHSPLGCFEDDVCLVQMEVLALLRPG